MRELKALFGVLAALVPVVYCGGLVYYFYGLSGSMDDVWRMGLGPTVIGLSIVGVLFCIAVLVKIVRIFIQPRSPGSGGRGGGDGWTPDGESGFDADDAVARYMARRSGEAVTGNPTVPPATRGDGPARRPSFGRKIT